MELVIKELNKTKKYRERQLEDFKRKIEMLAEHKVQLEQAIEDTKIELEQLDEAIKVLELEDDPFGNV